MDALKLAGWEREGGKECGRVRERERERGEGVWEGEGGREGRRGG